MNKKLKITLYISSILFIIIMFIFIVWLIIKNSVEKFENEEIENRYEIVYINLDRSVERKKLLEEQFNKYNIKNYRRFKAIDGNTYKLTNRDRSIFKYNEMGKIIREHQIELRPPEIGCWLSHYYIWKELINDKNNDMYIIMEDDSVLLSNIKTAVDTVKNKINGKTLMYLIHKSNLPMFEPLKHNVWCHQGCRCYIITKDLAKYLVEECKNVDYPVDNWMMQKYNTFNAFVFHPNNIIISGDYDKSTTKSYE
jgi:GR25 family glycosyltransferase involved in LPS biosynthesis